MKEKKHYSQSIQSVKVFAFCHPRTLFNSYSFYGINHLQARGAAFFSKTWTNFREKLWRSRAFVWLISTKTLQNSPDGHFISKVSSERHCFLFSFLCFPWEYVHAYCGGSSDRAKWGGGRRYTICGLYLRPKRFSRSSTLWLSRQAWVSRDSLKVDVLQEWRHNW